nr:acyltransferase family protein [Citrobacter sp. RHB25-C09]
MPEDLVSFGKTAALSMLGVSNFYFYIHTNYFESSSSEPLLHTWSLAVEEQYYIFWPLILMAVYKIKRASIKVALFSALFITSVGLSWYYVHQDKNLAYMMLPFRFFELMAGALLAINYRRTESLLKYKNILSVSGMILILTSAFLLNESSSFPGVLALPVTIGSTMLLASRGGIVNSFLSLKPIIYIGRVSYSFYLWHWPVIILAAYRGIELTTINAFALIALSFTLASISYHLVENPFRKLKSPLIVFPVLYALPLTACYFFMNYMDSTSGMKWRTQGMFDELNSNNSAHIKRSECMEKMKAGNFSECWLGVKKDKPDVLMIGDSFGNAYTPFIDVLAKDARIMIHDTMRSSTPSIPGVYVNDISKPLSKYNADSVMLYNNTRTNYANTIGAVIISDYFDIYNNNNKLLRLFGDKEIDYSASVYKLRVNYIKKLIRNGVKVYIIARPFNTIGTSGIAKLRSAKMKHAIGNADMFPYGMKKESREEYRLKHDIPEITLIDPNALLCSAKMKSVQPQSMATLFLESMEPILTTPQHRKWVRRT